MADDIVDAKSNEPEVEREDDCKNMEWEAPDGTFTKMKLQEGQGYLRPLLESTCVLDVHPKTCDKSEKDKTDQDEIVSLLSSLGISEDKRLEIKLGMAETQLMRIVEKCVMSMQKNEISEFTIKIPQKNEISSGAEKTDTSLCLVFTLCDFTEVTPVWQLASDEKYKYAMEHKERGTNLFKDGKIEAAFYQYSTAVKYLICIYECSSVINDDPEPDKNHKQEYLALECICYLNLAACQSKVSNFRSVINNCTHALELESSNVKGLYRRAQAYKACGKLEAARTDLKRAMKIEPKNRAVASLWQSCLK